MTDGDPINPFDEYTRQRVPGIYLGWQVNSRHLPVLQHDCFGRDYVLSW